jgi:nucleoside-diphosphate-sugar epimerase
VDRSRIFVTGASGLLGSNVCRLAVAQGRRVKGLVRNEADADVLRALGAEPVVGDIMDTTSMVAGVGGADCVVHCAAVIGGTWSTATSEEFERVNYGGSLNVLDCARDAGVGRTVLISSLVVFDPEQTVTEKSGMLPLSARTSPYARTKLAAYYEGMRRACAGEDVIFVMPGAIYGPSPFVDRAATDIVHRNPARCDHRKTDRVCAIPLTWPYIEDVAAIVLSAVDNGRAGRSYLAGGRPEDQLSLAEFCNLGCEMAGVEHRVRNLEIDAMGSDIGSMRVLAERTYPTPLIDPSYTNRTLNVTLTPVREGIERTVAWLKYHERI